MATDLDRFADILLKALPPPAPKLRCVLRTCYDTSPMPEEYPGESLLIIVLVDLQAPERRPDPYLGAGQRTYGEQADIGAVLDVEVPDTLERLVEELKNAGF